MQPVPTSKINIFEDVFVELIPELRKKVFSILKLNESELASLIIFLFRVMKKKTLILHVIDVGLINPSKTIRCDIISYTM